MVAGSRVLRSRRRCRWECRRRGSGERRACSFSGTGGLTCHQRNTGDGTSVHCADLLPPLLGPQSLRWQQALVQPWGPTRIVPKNPARELGDPAGSRCWQRFVGCWWHLCQSPKETLPLAMWCQAVLRVVGSRSYRTRDCPPCRSVRRPSYKGSRIASQTTLRVHMGGCSDVP